MSRRTPGGALFAGSARGLVLLLAVLALAVPLTLTDAVNEPDGTAQALASGSITIDLLADRATVSGGYAGVLAVGGDVHWRNRSGETRTITSPDGVLDSGPILDGGSFHASLPVAGSYTWSSEFGEGTILVEADFDGSNDARALDHIPDVAPPSRDPVDIGLHPDLAIELSRTVAIIGFTETATVQEARQALGTNWDIIGGLPEVGLVYAKTWLTSPTTSFATLDARIAQLRNHPAVEFASYDMPLTDSVVPPPSSDADSTGWYWEPPQSHPVGARTNWGLELSRVPQAWNLLDGARAGGAQDRGATVVVDSGFEEHVDLDRLQRLQLCAATIGSPDVSIDASCTTLNPSDHGNHVAGIVGADFDDVGVTGIDPLNRLYGLPWQFDGSTGPDGGVPLALTLLLRQIRSGALQNVNVVNLSIQLPAAKPADWWSAHDSDTCGPGIDDDDGPTSTEVCYPSNHDPTIVANSAMGAVLRRVVEAYVILLPDPPLIVNSTGNSSARYCPEQIDVVPLPGVDFPGCVPGTGVPQLGTVMSSLTWANANWRDSVGANPIISVESIGNIVGTTLTPQLDRSRFSNLEGDISTSGLTVSTESSAGSGGAGPCEPLNGPDQYCFQNGTSQASPAIAGIAGLLSAWDSTLTAAEIKQRLLTWVVADTTDGAAPRVDAFASLLSLNGAAHALADFSDPSEDGNRRVVYGADGTGTDDVVLATRPGFTSEPDGVVDMRDFRRFRDAWLLRCEISPEAGCPALSSIDLDGADDHPKRDLNGDGCVLLDIPGRDQACPSELSFPRADLNGDGTISRNASAPVPLLGDGSPATGPPADVDDQLPGDAVSMTDLEVFASQWDAGEPGTLGVEADDLADLMFSGDLTLVPDGLQSTSASVALVDDGTGATIGTYSIVIDGSSHPVLTVPSGRPYSLEVEAVGPTEVCRLTIGPFSVRPGEDRPIDLSAALNVVVDPDGLRPDETADVRVSAQSCSGAVEGLSVNLAIDPAGPGLAQLGSPTVVLGADGSGTTTVSSGSLRGAYVVTATADIPTGPAETSSRTATASFTVGESYELELAAVDDAPSGYFALDEYLAIGVPLGPSVNGSGDVGFGALIDNADRYAVYVAEPGDDPTLPTQADVVSGPVIPADGRVTGQPELNDAGQVAFTTVRSDGTDIYRGVYRGDAVGTVDELATGLSTLGVTSAPYSEVERPTINENGRVIFVATDQAGNERLAELQGALVVVGPETFGARPQLADDGTSVVQATITRNCADYPGVCPPGQSLIFDPIILAGPDLQAGRVAIAEGRVDGFEALSDPDISPLGDVIAFTGDRNGAAGVFISVRRPDGSWQVPIAVEGPSASGDLVDVVRDRPTVAQIAGGPSGPAGDRLLIAVKGNESGSAGPAAQGVFVIPVDLVATGDSVSPFAPAVDRPQLVAQIGDLVGGRTIARIELSDSLAAATSPAFDDDHWVAFYAEASDGSNMHVRARALPPPEVVVVPSGPGTGLRVIRPSVAEQAIVRPAMGPHLSEALPAWMAPREILPDDVAVLPGPHIAAVTVDDDTPTAREATRIVNRSRALDGTPAWGLADEIGNPTVLLNPELMAPDGELFVTYPTLGNEALLIGAPLSSGEYANTVAFTVVVQIGANRPPIGEILNAPILVAPGQSVTLNAKGVDPDGDRMSYTWDLDDDGVFDDGDFSAIALSAAQIQTVVCGGSCGLEQPNPIKVRILDDRGLDVVAQSTLTVSGFSDILLRLDPGLVQANPGTSARSYAFVDKPLGDPSVPVRMSIEGAPAGWSVFVDNEIDSGTSTLVSVSVPSSAPEGSFSFDVVATTGDVERRSTMTVVTLFGLIPECTATVRGTVTDELGAPISNAEFNPTMVFAPTVRTATDGTFSFDSILPRGATIERFYWTLIGPSGDTLYIQQTGGPHYARCDETTEINPVMGVVGDAVGLTMRAVAGIENPAQPNRPFATDQPMSDVTFRIQYTPDRFAIVQQRVTLSDGVGFFADLPTSNTRGDQLTYSVSASRLGYWSVTRSVRLSDLDEGLLIDAGDFPLIPACSGRVTTARVVDQYGEPVDGARVRISAPFFGDTLTTGVDGTVTFDQQVSLGTYNTPRLVTVRADAPSEWGNNDNDFESLEIGSCDEVLAQFELVLERPEPEVDYFGTLVGTVTDADTGQPLEGVSVSGGAGDRTFGTVTDAQGNWQAEVLIGTDPAAVWDYNVSFGRPQTHWPEFVAALLPVDSEVRVDAQLTARRVVELTGTVTDAETGEPVEGAYVITTARPGVGATDFSDPAGEYLLTGLELAQGFPSQGIPHNGPRLAYVGATFAFPGGPNPVPYWPVNRETTLMPDGPNVLDFQMIPVCESASVSGLVVNAATLEPLEGVDINAAGLRTLTDAQGRYFIDGIRPGTNNDPRVVTVYARRDGFFDASIDITTYCGAELIVDFGTPFGGFGKVVGTVIDIDTGDPIPDVFVGSSWGDSTSTAADGTYSFERAPLTSDGDPRDWTVSATRGFDRLQQVVTVSADADAVADFEFGTENLPPTAFPQSLGTDATTPLSITLTGNDPEGLQLTFDVVDGPVHGALTGDPPDLTYTPNGSVGDDTFTFTVSDGEHTSDPATVSIGVAAVQPNRPPVIGAPTAVEVTAGAPREIAVSAGDPDGDPLTFSLISDGEGLAELVDNDDGTATITVTTDESDVGRVVDIDVGVSDGDAGDATTIVVTVVAGQEPVNRPPDISIDAPNEVDEGSTVTFDASGTQDADGDAMTFAWTLVDFTGATLATGSGPTWSHEFVDDFVGAARLKVTDARRESAEAESGIIVVNVAPTVVIDLDGPRSGLAAALGIGAGSEITLSGSFTDPGADTYQLMVDWGDGSYEQLGHRAGAFAAGHMYSSAGSFTIVVEVCDDDDGCGIAGDVVTVGDGDSSPPATTPAPTTTTTTAVPGGTLPSTGSDGRGHVSVAIFVLLLGLMMLAVARPARRRFRP